MRCYKKEVKLSQEVTGVLRALGVEALYLFGSRAQGNAASSSDFDFGLLFEDGKLPRSQCGEEYQKIYDLLQDCVTVTTDIDIVFLEQAPLQLRYHVVRYGQVLLDANPLKRGRFEERTAEEHADFEPYRRLFEEATLARIG